MADGVDGFVGRLDMIDVRRNGYRYWSTEMKARIVSESFQPGARVIDVARRYDLGPNKLSEWRKKARDGHLILPAELLPALPSSSDTSLAEPAFVPLSICEEAKTPVITPGTTAQEASGYVTIEIDGDLVVKVPDDVAIDRAAALVRAIRGLT